VFCGLPLRPLPHLFYWVPSPLLFFLLDGPFYYLGNATLSVHLPVPLCLFVDRLSDVVEFFFCHASLCRRFAPPFFTPQLLFSIALFFRAPFLPLFLPNGAVTLMFFSGIFCPSVPYWLFFFFFPPNQPPLRNPRPRLVRRLTPPFLFLDH